MAQARSEGAGGRNPKLGWSLLACLCRGCHDGHLELVQLAEAPWWCTERALCWMPKRYSAAMCTYKGKRKSSNRMAQPLTAAR